MKDIGKSTQQDLRKRPILMIVLTMVAYCAFNVKAATINVTSVSALQTSINNSVSGDIINLANGHYTNNTLSISKSGITVQAASPGGVFLDGNNNIVISGNSNTFSGFQFTTNNISGGLPVESPTNAVTVTGNSNTITQLNFNGYYASKMVQLEGSNNTVSYCNFQNKPTDTTASKGGDGDMLQIIPNASKPGNNLIRYCSFQHMPGGGGDWGNECIRIGDGVYSLMISRTIVEYCYFEDTGFGDSEAISVKSRENILRYNTMNNNPEAMFCFRRGDNNVAYGNFFINSGGLRAKEANNIFCYNNYFEKSGVTGSANAVSYIYYTVNSTHVLDSLNFLHNTFVDCGNIDFGGIGATNGLWANNIFKKSGTIFVNPNNGTTFKNNIYTGTLGITITSGITKVDPKLALNSDGYYGLTSASPAIGAATNAYPAILNLPGIDTLLLDIKGLVRPVSRLLKDIGCEQYNASGTVINRPLKLSDVGPSYLKSLAGIESPKENLNFNIQVNSANRTLVVKYILPQISEVNLTIYNLAGLLQKTTKLIAANQQQTIDISDLKNGIYLARLSSDDITGNLKFLIGN